MRDGFANLWFEIEGTDPNGVRRADRRSIKSINQYTITPTRKLLEKELKEEGWKNLCPLRYLYAQ